MSASHLAIATSGITQVNSTASGFYMSLRNLNAHPQVCIATTEPFPSPPINFLKLFYCWAVTLPLKVVTRPFNPLEAEAEAESGGSL